MQQVCRTCSKEGEPHYCSRVVTVFEIAGKPLPEPRDECSHCSPNVQGKLTMGDQRLWLMQDVNPNEYETVNGEKHLKDWATAELSARIAKPDEDDLKSEIAAKDEKRRFNREMRGRVPTKAEIDQAANTAREILARERARRSGLILPG